MLSVLSVECRVLGVSSVPKEASVCAPKARTVAPSFPPSRFATCAGFRVRGIVGFRFCHFGFCDLLWSSVCWFVILFFVICDLCFVFGALGYQVKCFWIKVLGLRF